MRKLTRMLALLLALALLVPSALAEELRGYDKKQGYVYLTLGTFPQTAEGEVAPILWRVLQVKDGRAYILSEYVLEARRIHGDYNEYANKPTAKKNPGFDGDFTQTEMAQYLNGEFTKNFTAAEMALLSPDETLGMFTLLSSDELKDKNLGFSKDNDRKAWGTAYATSNGLFVYGSSRGNHSPYWSRTQSTSNRQGARCIKSKGELGYINVITLDEGMRPACWLDMTKVVIASGEGTKENPYTLQTGTAPAADAAAEADVPCCIPGECACCASCTCGCQD
ncbi:MAG: hypothetical protein IJ343_12740 [Clostridia bacterium]|nr:hypothetical protein [Clostridia bacterium]